VRRRVKTAVSAQRFLDAFIRVAHLFRPRRHRLSAGAYRAVMRERATTWREVAGPRAACHHCDITREHILCVCAPTPHRDSANVTMPF